MLALVSVMVTGNNGVEGAANAVATSSISSVPASAVVSESPLVAVPLVAVAPVATDAATTTTLAELVCTNSYTVAAGDFWVRIARRASISTGELLIANRASSDTPLYPDQVICLPDGVAVVVPTTQATVATTPAATTPATTPTTTVKPRSAPVATTPSSSSHSSK